MRLLKAHIQNFKLLEDIEVEFSTDPERPLTVIRAENGSGKTSLLYALTWAFFGAEGLPEEARQLRLISSAAPPRAPVNVQVMVEFEHTDDSGIATRYRLIRTSIQTPIDGTDRVDSTGDRARLLRITSAGEDDAPEGLLAKLLPQRLQHVFFTDGEDVQNFISGAGSVDQRQTQVHAAIRSLLGLEGLEIAADDLEQIARKFRAEVAKSAGGEVEEANAALVAIEEQIGAWQAQHAGLVEELRTMREQRTRWEKELDQIRGLGELEDLNRDIGGLERDLETLERDRGQILLAMRGLVRSEEFSWAFLDDRLAKGMKALDDLADRGVIPGVSIEVLVDRLELGRCICGETLAEGDSDGERRREHLRHLIEDQRQVADSSKRLTGTLHLARQSQATHDALVEDHHDFWSSRGELLQALVEKRDAIVSKTTIKKGKEEQRAKIDDARVQELVGQIQRVGIKLDSAVGTVSSLEHQISVAETEMEEKKRAVDAAEKARNKDVALASRKAVAEDLVLLAKGTLGVLEHDYVARVGSRMGELFMHIVGSDPDFDAGVFKGVHIADNFDIIVDTHHGLRLNPAFELNGASQRALTLAFIWALMEISDTEAPRIIDTPLGMVAGGVKTRMVETITDATAPNEPASQVVLMLTRSEIRDIETLLDERTGKVMTLSCSKDYPTDLVNDWKVDHPTILACKCTHRESCRICARRYDEQHGVVFRDRGES